MKHIPKEVDYAVLDVSSTAFEDGGTIPATFTCDGKNINPPLDIAHIPEAASSLALIVDDPDAPGGTWVHWVVWKIPVTHHIKENSIHGVEGVNDFGKQHYGGPCPPSGTHRYFFKVYALDYLPDLAVTTTKEGLEKAMSGHILGFESLTGLYSRKR